MNVTVDEAIERVEKVYAKVTGAQPPPISGSAAPLPAEQDAGLHVEERLRQLLSSMERCVPSLSAVAPAWIPRAIVTADKTGIDIAIDIPGVTGDQVQVLVEDRVVAVLGRRDGRTISPDERRIETCEVPLGPFVRSFQLTAPIARENVAAQLAAGVLTIRITTAEKRGEPSLPNEKT